MNSRKIIWAVNALLNKWAFGHIGRRSYLGKSLFINNKKNIYLGNQVRVYPGMRAELVDHDASVHIEDNVSIGQSFHIVSGAGDLVVGEGSVISANVFVTNCDHDYRDTKTNVLDQALLVKKTSIGKDCFIGYGAVLLAGTELGKHCIVGANSVLRGVYPDNSVIVGAPARVVKRFDENKKSWVRVD